jgi:hypothetical protein
MLTIEQKDKIGQELAGIFMLKHSKEFPERWNTSWGTKTNVGIYETFKRIGNMKEYELLMLH